MLGLHVDDFFMGLSLPKKENVSQLINVNHNKTRPSHSPSHLVLGVCYIGINKLICYLHLLVVCAFTL